VLEGFDIVGKHDIATHGLQSLANESSPREELGDAEVAVNVTARRSNHRHPLLSQSIEH